MTKDVVNVFRNAYLLILNALLLVSDVLIFKKENLILKFFAVQHLGVNQSQVVICP